MDQTLTKEKEILEKIKDKFKCEGNIQREKRIWVSLNNNDDLLACSRWLKKEGFIHLSAISASDWLEEKKFKLYFMVFSR